MLRRVQAVKAVRLRLAASAASVSAWACVVLALSLIGATPALAGPKVDTVVLDNGNRLTCEIKQLERGRLTMSTDALDTVRVYSGRIREIVSPRQFEVERADGTLHFGALAATQARGVRVEISPGSGVDVLLDDIVRITPIEASVWQRMDGHVDLGFSFAKADLETRYTLNADTEYKSKRYEGNVILASQNIVDDVDHCLKAGTSLHLTEAEAGNRDFVAGTLADVLNNKICPDAGRTRIFSPFGLGVLDIAVGHLVLETAKTTGSASAVSDFFSNSVRW